MSQSRESLLSLARRARNILHRLIGPRPPIGMLAPVLLRLSVDTKTRDALAALPRVGGMSAIPARAAVLGEVLDTVVPQVDRLHLFLHGYEDIPETARRPNVEITLAPLDHPYRASGKFLGLTRETAPCLYFTFDDDIAYRPGHVDRLRDALLRYGGKALVGIHAAHFAGPSFLHDRRSFPFRRWLWSDRLVDELGCGTMGLVSTALPIDPPAWPVGDIDDLMMAIAAERAHLPRIAVARPKGSCVPLDIDQTESLWAKAKRDDSRQSAYLAVLLGLMGRRVSARPAASGASPRP